RLPMLMVIHSLAAYLQLQVVWVYTEAHSLTELRDGKFRYNKIKTGHKSMRPHKMAKSFKRVILT
ncbi:hypothetical protein, partial [Vibrio sp. V40_P2S30T141]|uniref:hypothetical protein n=1 Tax=Vibrio sp. V40_P2S30T141 TaxID=1938691 RepID=UPI0023518142